MSFSGLVACIDAGVNIRTRLVFPAQDRLMIIPDLASLILRDFIACPHIPTNLPQALSLIRMIHFGSSTWKNESLSHTWRIWRPRLLLNNIKLHLGALHWQRISHRRKAGRLKFNAIVHWHHSHRDASSTPAYMGNRLKQIPIEGTYVARWDWSNLNLLINWPW